MCGLTGFLNGSGQLGEEAPSLATAMGSQIRHRGPDDHGVWIDADQGIALVHRRLSVVDLSPAGHQPMYSSCGRYVLVFNGEIYNHIALRSEVNKCLLATSWRGHSDTETLLAGISIWGVESILRRCIGMFAFALWDRRDKTLTLGRDRMGEKPLYYGWQGQGRAATFLFGSELAALKVHPAFNANIDRNALCLLVRHGYIPAPHAIYEGIGKLEAGCLLTVSRTQPTPSIQRYWSTSDVAVAGCANPFTGTPEQAVDALDVLLNSAVRQQMMADVPLGAFLSGGVDSSTVVALMQAQSAQKIKTFTIGFHEKGYNEAVHAKAVAAHLGTDHTELYVTPEQALDVIPRLPTLYCEPFADPSQIPTFLVAQLARQQVTVSLSGDAGDELFCGYSRYLIAERYWKNLSCLRPVSRQWLARGLAWFSPDWLRQTNLGHKLLRGSEVLAAGTLDALYLGMVSHWQDPSHVVIGGHEPPTLLTGRAPELLGLEDVPRMMALDMQTYLPDDILVKLDRAAMGVSLEGRVPFLDHRVVEFAWRLPQSMKQRDGVSKWVLRQVLYRHVPKELIDRPKMGFGVPIGDWLRGPLKDWAEALLNESRLIREGFFHSSPIRKKWAEHLAETHNWQYPLWNILMFQAWLEENCQ